MKAKLIINDKELEVDISEAELKKLEVQPEGLKKTGYERVMPDEMYYYVDEDGNVMSSSLTWEDEDESLYLVANCYSDEIVADNNARADRLMRQLRRFAVEHRRTELDWGYTQNKYYFYYEHTANIICVDSYKSSQDFGTIFFDTAETAELAIGTFRDELIWYFTEYKDSL